MEIKKIENKEKRKYMSLLLLADESEKMIDKYLDRGDMFVLSDEGDVKSSAVVTKEGEDTLELKNLATYEKDWNKGYASKLVRYIFDYYKDNKNIKSFLVGTGETGYTIDFYEKLGFKKSHKIKNFFVDNYDEPIIDNGVLLKDMIYLKKELF